MVGQISKTSLWPLVAVIIFFVWFVKNWYWKLQLTYATSNLSLYTPKNFSFSSDERKKKYDLEVSRGEILAKQKTVVIATMVRDVESRVAVIKKKVEATGDMFADYRVLVVENDSKDGTRAELLKWVSENPRVTVLGCGYNEKMCKLPKTPKTEGHSVDRGRIQKMVDLRNIYLAEIRGESTNGRANLEGIRSNPYLGSSDYCFFWDLDSISSVYLDGIAHSINLLESQPEISVVAANGLYRWGAFTIFYDTYALLHTNEKFNIKDKRSHDIRKGLWEARYSRGDDPVEVDSGFGGFAIYRTKNLLADGVKYDMTPGENIECEHVRLHKHLSGKKILNPSLLNLILLND